LFPIIVC